MANKKKRPLRCATTELIAFRLPVDLVDALRAEAKELDCSCAGVVSAALTLYFAEKEDAEG